MVKKDFRSRFFILGQAPSMLDLLIASCLYNTSLFYGAVVQLLGMPVCHDGGAFESTHSAQSMRSIRQLAINNLPILLVFLIVFSVAQRLHSQLCALRFAFDTNKNSAQYRWVIDCVVTNRTTEIFFVISFHGKVTLSIFNQITDMARRNEHTQEEIKEMIVQAAEKIIIKDGLAALKVRKIASDIGYTVGSIYMVFDNMADLILHIKGRTLDDLAFCLDQVATPAHDSEQTIIELAKAYLFFANENYHRWSMIFEQNPDQPDPLPDWYQQKVKQMFICVDQLFQQIAVDQSVEQIHMAARALWGGVHGICVLSLAGKLEMAGINNMEKIVELLVINFLRGWKNS